MQASPKMMLPLSSALVQKTVGCGLPPRADDAPDARAETLPVLLDTRAELRPPDALGLLELVVVADTLAERS
jgi:hypothetical protein